MSSNYIDDGHRVYLADNVISYSKGVFAAGYQLEAILVSHEYLEQRLNKLYDRVNHARQTVHRQFKQLIELFRSKNLLSEEDYDILNEFNRLRNVNSNQILDSSITLRGAKKGDMHKAMNLAEECEKIISKIDSKLSQEKQRQKRRK